MFPAVAGVQPETSRSIKPRERDLGDLRLFFLVRILTRPTNHPRHAACASNYESKPVRPRNFKHNIATPRMQPAPTILLRFCPRITRITRMRKSQDLREIENIRVHWRDSREVFYMLPAERSVAKIFTEATLDRNRLTPRSISTHPRGA